MNKVKRLEEKIGSHDLHQRLNQSKRVEIESWVIILDGDDVWLVNPYGLDVGVYKNDVAGCETILARISSDKHEKEWGML